MKTKLLRKIKRNAYITRIGNNLYRAEIKSGWFWCGGDNEPTTKKKVNESMRELILFVANLYFSRKGKRAFPNCKKKLKK